MDRGTARLEARICARLPVLKNFIFSRVRSAATAQDIYSEALLSVWRKIRRGKFNEAYSIDSSMFWFGRSAMANYFRRENRYNSFAHDEYPDYCSASARNHEREYEMAAENRLFMEKTMRGMSAIYRKILVLLLFQNMHQHEIAETLNMPETTLGCRLRTMRNNFGLHLGRYERKRRIEASAEKA